jgi:hypothetical protein
MKERERHTHIITREDSRLISHLTRPNKVLAFYLLMKQMRCDLALSLSVVFVCNHLSSLCTLYKLLNYHIRLQNNCSIREQIIIDWREKKTRQE